MPRQPGLPRHGLKNSENTPEELLHAAQEFEGPIVGTLFYTHNRSIEVCDTRILEAFDFTAQRVFIADDGDILRTLYTLTIQHCTVTGQLPVHHQRFPNGFPCLIYIGRQHDGNAANDGGIGSP